MSENGRHALLVDGKPFLMLGAQVNNSSNYPSQLPMVWPTIAKLGANTVEVPIGWEQIEPVEGRFDFSFLDTLVAQARERNVRLVLLWFGTWKNTAPAYAPEWVKTNGKRFPRLIKKDGTASYALSPFGAETRAADKRAFVALMTRLKAIDPQHTVIMVQPENESGTYGSVRDYSPAAEAAFRAPVPGAVAKRLGKGSGNWTQLFGKDADEFFHAWAIASYIGEIAAAGKAVKPLPMYVNASLRDPFKDQDPASYASGGPTWNVMDVWKAAAPAIDILAPDIYTRDSAPYEKNLDRYGRADNALFVPETGNDVQYARYLWTVLGRGGIGFSPFGMDDTGYQNYPLGGKGVDHEALAPFVEAYQVIAPMAHDWAAIALKHPTWGASKPDDGAEQSTVMGGWKIGVRYGQWQFASSDASWLGKFDKPPAADKAVGGALVAQLGPNEFLVTGNRARVTFSLAEANGGSMQLLRVEQGHFDAGRWVFDRLWNGDQVDYGLNFTDRPEVLKVKLGRYGGGRTIAVGETGN